MPFLDNIIYSNDTTVNENYACFQIMSEKNNSNVSGNTGPENKKDVLLSHSEEQLLKERGYVINRQLGEGSYARVYLATHVKEGKPERTLACKVINTKIAPREFIVKFLPREIDILSKITHPHIVHVFTIYHKMYNFLIFMRFAEMGDLLDYIINKTELSENVCRVWFHQLSSAIYYLHNLNIAHRDIKCENVLITRNFNVKLADFGFARYVANNTGKQMLSNTFCGSLAYASPEILRGRAYFPKTSDLWSLGIVLFIMLNKSMPFHDTTVKTLYKQQIAKKWRFRSKTEPTLTQTVINLVVNLLEPDFRKRISINEMIKDKWFLEGGLHLTEECRQALENTSKLKDEMVAKKHSKAKSWNGNEKDFTVVSIEKEPMFNLSLYFDPTGQSTSIQAPRTSTKDRRGSVVPSNVYVAADDRSGGIPVRMTSANNVSAQDSDDK